MSEARNEGGSAKAVSTDFIYQRSRALFFSPMWSNLLSQHRRYPARLGCQLLQTGQILIKRSGYKRNPWFVCVCFFFFWNTPACTEDKIAVTQIRLPPTAACSFMNHKCRKKWESRNLSQKTGKMWHIYFTTIKPHGFFHRSLKWQNLIFCFLCLHIVMNGGCKKKNIQ